MKEQFVSYDMSVKLKAFGFNEICFGYYYESEEEVHGQFFPEIKLMIELTVYNRLCVKAPLWQQVFGWFRENHNLHATPIRYNHNIDDSYDFIINGKVHHINSSFETARKKCIEELIKLITI